MATATKDLFQYGAYTLPQASRLSRVSLRSVNYWFDEDSSRGPAIRRHMPKNEDGLISFVDLVQLIGVHTIRSKHKVSLQKIRQAIRNTEDIKGITFPFARNSAKAYLWNGEIVFKTDNGDLVEATGKHARSFVMHPIILPYLEDLTFEGDLPSAYRPLEYILLSPKRQWGAPIVESCNYTVETLVSAVEAEGSIEAAADICGVTEKDVRAALRYADHLTGIAA